LRHVKSVDNSVDSSPSSRPGRDAALCKASMISGVILAFPGGDAAPVSNEGVVRSLAVLVPAAVEHLVRDVVLAGLRTGARSELDAIADHAGCSLLFADSEAEALRLGLEAARRPLALVMRAGYAPRQGFLAELADFASNAASPAMRGGAVLREERRGLARFASLSAAPAALLASRAGLLEQDFRGFADLTRRMRPKTRFECGVLRIR
jgi:hypothetical protein